MTAQTLRNIGIFAHVDAGKTTTTEHMLYESGAIRALGSVDQGTAQTDSLEIERERGISVRSAATSLMWKGIHINLVDTPGHVDFLSEVERSMRVMDGAILIISAAEGVQSQTETVWHALRTMGIPTLIFVNKMDRLGVSIAQVMQDINRLLTVHTVPLQTPLGEGEEFTGIMPVWNGEAIENGFGFTPGLVLEKVADLDDDILSRIIDEEEISSTELHKKLQALSREAKLFPVCFGSSQRGLGIRELLDAAIEYLPAPAGDEMEALSGIVFKIERDKQMGRTSFVRLYRGSLKNRDAVTNLTREVQEKVTQIRKMNGQKYTDLGQLQAGDIAAVYGLSQSQIGDILGSPIGIPPSPSLAVPLLTVQVQAKDESRYQELVEALHELTEEDPLLDLQWLQSERELHVKVMGAIQLEILSSLLLTRFGLEAQFSQPSIIYKETPAQAGEGFIAYTMPKPCWAILRFAIEPLPRGSGLIYSSVVRSEHLLSSYQNEVKRRVPEALQQGLYGWEVTDLKVTLIEGEHHVWHTHPLDFVVATPMGIMNGLASTGTTLLEPMLRFRITVPEEFGGKILSELVQMRAEFEAPSVIHGRCIIEGIIPAATSLEYPVRLRSMTSGKGVMASSFFGYQACPPDVQAERKRHGVNPLDQSKYILSVRSALST
ncbi:TetM/TetW/TetO/TetS family tetracycline resistance ribosomal protection protein [Paenibacillus sp. KQZ6P-2]|uniref:TetM/TetW/TetO/TetS family tetracycline resistance ribosomal protection protein n=1 Tax=Paenibacillus mangrovi TaxID=2931978 RepID=A0A9X1WMF2_9BACL|nr:TetM/TetW/TetO/TetS family tetracycline resistance ribosomal protection protein [Paenibacillus mangrovi]MCJ8010540.1 TetM/TetW/TetO/TetS family tetracycline resistance ribosomal protection protein [Paenibacillus mangrovi]